jgi:hypothetical protein
MDVICDSFRYTLSTMATILCVVAASLGSGRLIFYLAGMNDTGVLDEIRVGMVVPLLLLVCWIVCKYITEEYRCIICGLTFE